MKSLVGEWVVCYRNPKGEPKRRLFRRHVNACRFAQRLRRDGKKCQVKRMRVDVLVVDPESGDFLVVRERMTFKDAAMFSVSWAKKSRDGGMVIWPTGVPYPSSWVVTTDEPMTEHGVSATSEAGRRDA